MGEEVEGAIKHVEKMDEAVARKDAFENKIK
jgi:hypothetical protein